MTLPQQIAKHFREVHTGGNWTDVNLKDTLAGISWQQANEKVHSLNSIVALVYHINYYIHAVTAVMEGNPLDAHDKFSFNHPAINSEEDWQELLNKTWAEAEHFAKLVEQLPEEKLWQNIAYEKYGNYYRNIHGIIEHTHYHLGQIVLIKKILSQSNS